MDEPAQRYINIRVFRRMARMIEEWKGEERSRQRAVRVFLWLTAAAIVAGTALLVYLSR
jgi:hypothetical protein